MEVSGWETAAALAKALIYAATLGACGAVFFLNYSGVLLKAPQRRRIHRCVALLLLVAILASAAKISLLAGSMNDDLAGMLDSSFAGMILRAGEGRSVAMRLAGLIICSAALMSKRPMNLVATVGALLAAGSFAAVGHVHALKPIGAATLILVLHLWCGAFWLGALWPLLQVARDGDVMQTAAVATRFGKIAMTLVAALIVAGTLLLFRFLGSVSELWLSPYGRMLSLKLLVVAALLCAAALNKLKLTPHLAAGDARAAIYLRRSILTEMLLGGAILLVTAALTSFAGPPGVT